MENSTNFLFIRPLSALPDGLPILVTVIWSPELGLALRWRSTDSFVHSASDLPERASR
jgi:hypothetical protein